MAMSGGQGYCVVDETSTSGNRVRLYIYVKEKSQNTSTNSTILRLGMYVNSTYDIGAWVKSSDSYIGTATSGSNCYTFDGSISKGSGIRWLIENKEVTVKHNTDGTKSVKIYWKWGINAYTSYISGYQNPSGSKTVTLTTIPQASTITSANDVTLNGSNQTCTVQVSRKSSSFYHKATITCGSKSVTSNAFATSANITIPNSWLSEFPNATSKRATVTLTTYTSRACTTRVGSTTSTTIQIKAGSSIKPSATNLKLTASVVNGINGYYVKGKSSVKLTTSGAQAGTGASIASYIFTGSNISGSSSTYTGTSSTKTSSIIQSAGNLSYSVQVKDTRGRLSDKKTVKINVIDYTLPAITSLKVERVNGDDTKATVTVRITYKQITVGSTVNEPILTIKKGSENATGILSNPESSSTNSTTNIVTNTYKYTYTGLAETDKPTITATLYDMICGDSNTTTKSVNLSSATRMLNFASNGKTLAVGGFATPNSSTNRFECHWDAYLNKDIYFDQTNEQRFTFGNASKSNWRVNLYKGSTSSTTVMGVYDVTNDRLVWKYMNDKNFYFGSSIGITSNYDTKFAIFCKMQDKKDHDILVRNNDGLTVAVGSYIGNEYSSSTRLNLRGGIVRLVNASGETTISDERLKTDWEDLNKYSEFYDNIEPKSFKYINGSSGRNHIGFSAQQIEQSLVSSGLSTSDFAGLVKYKVDPSSEEYNGYDEEYGLIYSEFIALNTYMIQKLKSENEELKNKVSLLEEKLTSAITEIENLKESIKNEA